MHNPYLRRPSPARGEVEQPGNIEWQTRPAPPTEFENRLGDALERVFAAGAESLAQVVAQLNAEGSHDEHGRPWTEASFGDTMQRLGE